MEQEKEYYAFISYKREDEKWAKWLQDKLEHYKFPTNLNGRTDLPKNIRPTFRDVTDLKPGLLAEEINNALHNSQWLIVVCSPRSAKSPWVCKEAQTFIDLGRADHIIPFVIEGNPFSNDTATECYPDALLNLTGSRELLAANINEMGRDAAAIKVVARMFNLRFDALWQRFEREKRRKLWIWICGSILIALLGISIGGYFVRQNNIIERQNNRLQTDSVIMAEHISRIQNDSITLTAQNDSILLQNHLILIQRDSLALTTRRLELSNKLLAEERNHLKNQIFQTEIAKVPSIIDNDGVKTAYDHIVSLSAKSPLSNEQKNIINNQLYFLADKTRKDYYLYSRFSCKEGEINRMCISPNDSIIAVASWYGGTVSLIDINNPSKTIVLDNYDEIKKRPGKVEFSKDSKRLWVKYGSIFTGYDLCQWDIKNKTYSSILDNNLKKEIRDFCPIGSGIIVKCYGKDRDYVCFLDDTGNENTIVSEEKDISAISNINDSLFCISSSDKISIYNINQIDKPLLCYPLEYERVKYLIGAGNRIAALYSNDTIVVYNAICQGKQVIERNWFFDKVYYEGAIRFSKNGKKLFALDGYSLYDVNPYNGISLWDGPHHIGYETNSLHGQLVTLGDKIILSDAHEIKILAPNPRFAPGEYLWDGDVGFNSSSSQFAGFVSRKDSLFFCAIGTRTIKEENGDYRILHRDNVIVISDFQKKQLDVVDGHTNQITGLFYNEKTKELYSCSMDSLMLIYNIITKQKKQVRFCCELNCLTLADEKCYVGDEEGKIHVLKKSEIIATKKIHDKGISQIIIDKKHGTIISGDKKGNIVLLKDNLTIIKIVKFSSAEITSLLPDNNGNIIVGQRDGYVRVCDCELNLINSKKIGEGITSIDNNDIGQIVVCTKQNEHIDTYGSEDTYVMTVNDLLVLYRLKNMHAPNKLWWISEYDLLGTNGIRYFSWHLPRNILFDIISVS